MIKVLIVEDEEIIRKGLIYTFDWSALGCVVVGEAKDGQSGLKSIETLSPDIVISDIRMPDMSGLEMIEKGLKNHNFCSIVLTGYSEFEYAKQAVSLRVFEYLLKPVDEDLLIKTILKARSHIEELNLLSSINKRNPEYMLNDFEVLLREGRKLNYYVHTTLMMVQAQYQERLNINDIAEQLDVSKSYLSKKFKEETGMTFVEFLNRYRINQAIQLLEQGDLRILEVATKVGFSQYKNFSKVFRKYLNMTPTEFLESNVRVIPKQ